MAKFIKICGKDTNGLSSENQIYIINVDKIKHIEMTVNGIDIYIVLDDIKILTYDSSFIKELIDEKNEEKESSNDKENVVTATNSSELKPLDSIYRLTNKIRKNKNYIANALIKNNVKTIQDLIDLGQLGIGRLDGIGDTSKRTLIKVCMDNKIDIPYYPKRKQNEK